MGFVINLGTMNKRINSTATLFNKDYNATVVLKNNCSIVRPTFIIERQPPSSKAQADFAKFNYLYCDEFHRYYWIDDIVFMSGGSGSSGAFCEIHCHVDVLASYKSAITDLHSYVLYCSDKKYSTMEIDDARLSPEVPVNIPPIHVLQSNPFIDNDGDDDAGSFIMKCETMLNATSTTMTWVMTPTNFGNMVSAFWNNFSQSYTGSTVDAFTTWLANQLGGVGDITQFIHECYWVPIDYDKFTKMTDTGNVCIANTDTGVQGKYYLIPLEIHKLNPNPGTLLTNLPITNSGTINDGLPHFLNGSKYVSLALKGAAGVVDISSDSFVKSTVQPMIQSKWVFDYIQGSYICEIWNTATNDFLGSLSGEVRVDFRDMVGNGSGGKQDLAKNTIGNIVGPALKMVGMAASMGATGAASMATNIAGSDVLSDASKSAMTKKLNANASVMNTTEKITTGISGAFCNSNRSINACGGGGHFSNSYASFIMSLMNLANTDAVPAAFCQIVGSACVPTIYALGNYDKYAAQYGYPCSRWLKLGDLAEGYIQCSNADINMKAGTVGMLPSEASEINQFLNSGFYKETSPGVPT